MYGYFMQDSDLAHTVNLSVCRRRGMLQTVDDSQVVAS